MSLGELNMTACPAPDYTAPHCAGHYCRLQTHCALHYNTGEPASFWIRRDMNSEGCEHFQAVAVVKNGP